MDETVALLRVLYKLDIKSAYYRNFEELHLYCRSMYEVMEKDYKERILVKDG